MKLNTQISMTVSYCSAGMFCCTKWAYIRMDFYYVWLQIEQVSFLSKMIHHHFTCGYK
jgi:hypothetical protein